MHAQDFAILFIGNHLHKTLVRADDGRFGVSQKGKFAYFDLASALARLSLSQSHAADLRLAISRARNVVAIQRLCRLARDFRDRHNALHKAHMRKLWEARNDVAGGVDSRLFRLHPFVGFDEAALRLDPSLFQADVFRTWRAADGDQHLFRFERLRLAFRIGQADLHPVFGLFHLLHLHA